MSTDIYGPDDFGGDEYADAPLADPTPAEIDAFTRSERAHAEALENAAREALIAAAHRFFAEYDGATPAIRAVRFEARLHEYDDDHGARSRVECRVRLVLAADAVVAADELITIGEGAASLDDVVDTHGWAIPVDGAIVVTRDGTEVAS